MCGCEYRTRTGVDTRWSKNEKEQMTRKWCSIVIVIGLGCSHEVWGTVSRTKEGGGDVRDCVFLVLEGKGGCRV